MPELDAFGYPPDMENYRVDVYTNGTQTCAVRITHVPSGKTVTREGRCQLLTRREAFAALVEAVRGPVDVR